MFFLFKPWVLPRRGRPGDSAGGRYNLGASGATTGVGLSACTTDGRQPQQFSRTYFMPLESATYITDLVATNPVHTDGLNNTDAHERLIKTVLLNTFPNLNAPVTATPTALNNASALATPGLILVPQQSPTLGGAIEFEPAAATGGGVTIANGAASGATGVLGVVITDATNSNPHAVLAIDYTGDVAALTSLNAPSILQNSHPLVPSGVILMWSGTVALIPAGWLLCDGTNGTPDLRGRFIIGAGSAYNPGDTGGGSSATTSSDGAHTHTGQTGSGGAQSLAGASDVQGAHEHGGSDGSVALTLAQIPSHQHAVALATTGLSGGSNAMGTTNALASSTLTDSQGSGQGHSHTISTDGAHSHNIAVQSVSAHVHTISSDGSHDHTISNVLPPYLALAYIMKS